MNVRTRPFDSLLGVRQGECLSPFLFSMYINDIEEMIKKDGFKGLDLGHVKLFMLFYADDSVIISETREDLQLGLKSLENYNNRFRLKVNTSKTKIVIFHKGGRLSQNDRFFL